jgi:hypothetical protein
VPFAPPADRAEIQTIDIWMTIVTGSEPLDEIEMGGEDRRVIQNWHLNPWRWSC